MFYRRLDTLASEELQEHVAAIHRDGHAEIYASPVIDLWNVREAHQVPDRLRIAQRHGMPPFECGLVPIETDREQRRLQCIDLVIELGIDADLLVDGAGVTEAFHSCLYVGAPHGDGAGLAIAAQHLHGVQAEGAEVAKSSGRR